jgi:DhnA family fructose-bisphosphate aldolase class Ia
VILQAHSAGMVRRMGRFFSGENDTAIIVAMDHGMGAVPKGLERIRPVLERVLQADPDGILLNSSMARQHIDLLARRNAPSLTVGIDFVTHEDPHTSSSVAAHYPQISVEEALRLGADSVKSMLVMGGSDREAFARNVSYLRTMAEECRLWEMPLMIEPYLWGDRVPEDPAGRAALNADGARLAVEFGADIVKLEYAGEPDEFAEVVAQCPVPIIILGGPKRPAQRDTIADIVNAGKAGAKGIAIGRNVWGQADSRKMVRALTIALVRQDLDAAMAALE